MLELLAYAEEFRRSGAAGFLPSEGETDADRLALQLFRLACAGDESNVARILVPLQGVPQLWNEVQAAMYRLDVEARRKATLRAAGIQPSTTPMTSPPKPRSLTSCASDADGEAVAKRDRKSLETEAIAALLTVGPNVTQIAKRIGVKRTTLLGWPEFRKRYEQVKAQAEHEKDSRRRHGYKSANGNLETWEDDDEVTVE